MSAMGKTLSIEYTANIWQEGEQCVAHAMPLDVMSAGRTPEEARKVLDEAVHLFLGTAAEASTLDLLDEAGYQRECESATGGVP
jgi:predicted RNase H-like HicB family nuclease